MLARRRTSTGNGTTRSPGEQSDTGRVVAWSDRLPISRKAGVAIAVPLLVILAIAWFQPFQARPVVQSPASAAAMKPPIQGLVDRQGIPPQPAPTNTPPTVADYRAKVKNFVIDVNWSDIQPNGSTDFDTSVIDGELSTATSLGMSVRLRVLSGINAPAWAKKLCDTGNGTCTPLPWTDDASATNLCPNSSCTIPRFWSTAFANAYKGLQQKMSNKYESNATVREVTDTMCSTVYAEPFLLQLADQANVTTLHNAGFDSTKHAACMKTSLDIHASTWIQTRTGLAFNPYRVLNTDGTLGSELANPSPSNTSTVENDVMHYCRQVLGSRCVISNYSIYDGRDAPGNDDYIDLYTLMKNTGPPIAFQTATPPKIGDWKITLDKSVAYGANSIELPGTANGYVCWVSPQTSYSDVTTYCNNNANNSTGKQAALTYFGTINSQLNGQAIGSDPGTGGGGGGTVTAPIVTISAVPGSVTAGSTSTLTWNVTGSGVTCTASDGWSGTKAVNGTQTVTPTATTTYTLACSNAGGSASNSATVTVNTAGFSAEDLNQDGHVNLLDFSLLAAKYGQTGTNLGRADINGDGKVNLLDFSLLAAQYGN